MAHAFPTHRRTLRFVAVVALAGSLAAGAAPAFAQSTSTSDRATGERYWVELVVGSWRPDLTGAVSSDQLGLIGSRIDFVSDLGFGAGRFTDVRLVLRPAKKHRFRFQYTPMEFAGDSILSRDIAFAGQVYPVALPVQSLLSWKVMRIGYEWDFFYRSRGFVGILLEARMTDLSASLDSIVGSGSIAGSAPLPAIGVVGRAYPLRNLALNVEVSGLTIGDVSPSHAFDTMDAELSATFNLTNNVGVTGGWRRMNTNIRFDTDRGELDFRGLWFGGAIRY
jgi:hypothetical protein